MRREWRCGGWDAVVELGRQLAGSYLVEGAVSGTHLVVGKTMAFDGLLMRFTFFCFCL